MFPPARPKPQALPDRFYCLSSDDRDSLLSLSSLSSTPLVASQQCVMPVTVLSQSVPARKPPRPTSCLLRRVSNGASRDIRPSPVGVTVTSS